MKISMVICRFKEELGWLQHIPKEINIYVFNKNKDDIAVENATVYNKCQNIGRESEVYLRYILQEYNNLPDIVIFTQGYPQEHNRNFNHLVYRMSKEGLDQDYYVLSSYWRDNEFPHPDIVKMYDGKVNYIETASRYTLCPLKHWDEGIKGVYHDYIRLHPEIKAGDDIINHFCRLIGLDDKDFGESHFFQFGYSGIFAVRKEAILKHPLNFYFNCYSLNNRNDTYGFFFERTWMKMFS